MRIETARTPSLGALSQVIAISEAENRQKVDKFKPVYLSIYDVYEKKFKFFEHTAYDLYHAYIH